MNGVYKIGYCISVCQGDLSVRIWHNICLVKGGWIFHHFTNFDTAGLKVICDDTSPGLLLNLLARTSRGWAEGSPGVLDERTRLGASLAAFAKSKFSTDMDGHRHPSNVSAASKTLVELQVSGSRPAMP